MVRAKLVPALFLILMFSFLYSNPLYAQSKIIAIVNTDVITQKEMDDFVNFTRIQLSRELSGKELEDRILALKKDILFKLIEDRLILQDAKKAKIVVDPVKIKARISEIKKRYGSETAFQDAIAKQGLVQADIENKIREQILMYALIETKVRSKITISPSEVTQFYNENPQKFLAPEERLVEVITSSGGQDTLNSVYRELLKGKQMADMVFRYPIQVSDLTVAQTGEFKKEITDVVFKLDINGFSRPVTVDNKYYIFRLKEIIPPRQAAPSEVKDGIYSFLEEKKMQEGLTKLLDGLKKQTYIKIF